MLDFIVMQMSKGNREKGYCKPWAQHVFASKRINVLCAQTRKLTCEFNQLQDYLHNVWFGEVLFKQMYISLRLFVCLFVLFLHPQIILSRVDDTFSPISDIHQSHQYQLSNHILLQFVLVGSSGILLLFLLFIIIIFQKI